MSHTFVKQEKYMKVKDLIEQLQKVNGDYDIFIGSKNNHHLLSHVTLEEDTRTDLHTDSSTKSILVRLS